jgi:hypothetical protein
MSMREDCGLKNDTEENFRNCRNCGNRIGIRCTEHDVYVSLDDLCPAWEDDFKVVLDKDNGILSVTGTFNIACTLEGEEGE